MKLNSLLTLLVLAIGTLSYSAASHADNIVIFGASGTFGGKLVREALDRGHQVYGVSRSPQNFTYTEENFTAVEGNPTELGWVQAILEMEIDSIVVALGDRVAKTPEETSMHLAAVTLTTALAEQGKQGPPVIVLGGGNTSAETKEGMLEILKARGGTGSPDNRLSMIFLSQWATYKTYAASTINWTYVATPATVLGVRDGEDVRTGEYRASIDGTLDREAGTALSISDVAVAMIDFAESGEYSQMRVVIAQ